MQKPRLLPACLCILAVSGPSMPSATRAADTLNRVRTSGVLQNVLVDNYPPFGFIDEHNQLAGFDVDVARAVATRLGVRLKLSTPGWEAIAAGHWHGRWDVCICSMSPTRERAKVLDFPARYYSSPAVLIVNARDTRIRSAADLSGRRVGAGTGSSYEAYLHGALQIPGGRAIDYPFHDVLVIPGDETVNFRNLALGPGLRLDAIVSDLATARGHAPPGGPLRVLTGTLYAEPNVVATDKGDSEWNATLAGIIGQLQADGTLARISRRWLDMDATGNEP